MIDEYAHRMGRLSKPATPPPAQTPAPTPQISMADLLAEQERDIQMRADKARALIAPATPTPQPAEPVVTLSDGSQPLPLGTVPSNKHTTEQLKDWLARTRKAAQSQ
jgi:hypothetical protein